MIPNLFCCSNGYAFLKASAKSSTKPGQPKKRSEKGACEAKMEHFPLRDMLTRRCTLLAAKIAELEAQLRKSLADLKLSQVARMSLDCAKL
jgi:hypothetical protein